MVTLTYDLLQKKIIALAVAGLVSGAAFAQSNVTVYGVADAYWAHGSGNGNDVNVIHSGGLSGSRIGFKGTEDIGNGLKALFTLEYGLAIDNNSGVGVNEVTAANTVATGTQARQQFVGLTGGFGTAVAGRLQTPGYNFAVKYDAHGASIFSPVGQLSDNAASSITGRDALGRLNNAAAYVSPNFSGLVVTAAYAYGQGGENVDVGGVDPQNIWGVDVEYDAGPLSVGFAHHNINDMGGVGGTDQTETALGLNYNFGVVKLFASYQTHKNDNNATGTTFNSRMWNIGARMPIGNGSVGLAYAQLKDKEADGKAKSWGVDYQHNLSKRTTAYVGYSRVSNNDNMAYGLTNLGSTPSAGDGKESQLGFGLRHTF